MDDTPDLSDITNTRGSRGSFRGETFDTDESPHKPWDKPMEYSKITSAPAPVSCEEEDDMDIPDRLTIGPGATAARLDLQRCTIRVHQQLVEQIKTHSMKPPAVKEDDSGRCQGELWLKSRVPMMGWKKRYGSIVDHQYFGPVLFLFKYDAGGNVALNNSMMIVLDDSSVRLGKNTTTKDKDYRCEFVLCTGKRRYIVAANHTMRRDYWIRHLDALKKHARTIDTYS